MTMLPAGTNVVMIMMNPLNQLNSGQSGSETRRRMMLISASAKRSMLVACANAKFGAKYKHTP